MNWLMILILVSLLVYLVVNSLVLRKLYRKNKLGNVTLIVISFVIGVAVGSGNFLFYVWLPILLALIVYEWPRLKALLTHQ